MHCFTFVDSGVVPRKSPLGQLSAHSDCSVALLRGVLIVIYLALQGRITVMWSFQPDTRS